MNIESRDLNLLRLFHVLYEERNLTQAARRVALSQPALSHQLARLRHEWGDPLFVRAPRGLTPTPRAHALAPAVDRLVRELEVFYQARGADDFLREPARLRLTTTDYVEQTLLPGLLPRLRAQAPELVIVTQATRGQLPRAELESGACDLAIAGFYEDLPDTLRQQRLLHEDFVVLAWRRHPALRRGLDLARFVAAEHLLTTLTGDLHGRVDDALAARGLKRRVVAGLSSFISPTRLVRDGPWLLTCLRSIAEAAVALDPELKIHPLPLELPGVDIVQVWHERTDADPLRRWVRQQILAVAKEMARA